MTPESIYRKTEIAFQMVMDFDEQEFNSLPNDKIFRLFLIESICRRQKKKCELKIEICFGKGKKLLAKGENAVYQHFLLFPQCFQKSTIPGLLKVRIVW